MRPLNEWDESDLLALISNQVQESLTLDYKQSSALTNNNVRSELSKDVSSFANSAGGRIIYGIEEVGNLPVAIDGGVDPAVMARERLEQMIDANVKPRIVGLFIKPIPLSNGNLAYVIDIPQGTSLAPHMASDNRYHRRQNFTTAAMEDHEVRDVMRRSTAPHPIVRFGWNRSLDNPATGQLSATITTLTSEPILYCVVTLVLDKGLVPDDTRFHEWEGRSEVQFQAMGRSVNAVSTSRKLIAPRNMPIFREKRWNILQTEIPTPNDNLYFIAYTVECPGFAETVIASVAAQAGRLIVISGPNDLIR